MAGQSALAESLLSRLSQRDQKNPSPNKRVEENSGTLHNTKNIYIYIEVSGVSCVSFFSEMRSGWNCVSVGGGWLANFLCGRANVCRLEA